MSAGTPVRTCGMCGAEGARLSRCGGCRVTFYCERACQKAHWRVHKAICAKTVAEGVREGESRDHANARIAETMLQAVVDAGGTAADTTDVPMHRFEFAHRVCADGTCAIIVPDGADECVHSGTSACAEERSMTRGVDGEMVELVHMCKDRPPIGQYTAPTEPAASAWVKDMRVIKWFGAGVRGWYFKNQPDAVTMLSVTRAADGTVQTRERDT